MSTERIELLLRHQEAAYVEVDHLIATRDAVREALGDEADGYVRLACIDAEIVKADRSIVQRKAKIEEMQRAEARRDPAPDRLTRLLGAQESAREERAALVLAREVIQREADAAGQSDLSDAQDRAYRELTKEIADVDDEISARSEEIEVLAALSAVSRTTT